MATKLNVLDASWLLVESARTPMHVAGLQIFKLPSDAPPDFMRTLFAWFRSYGVTAPPFTYRLRQSRLSKLAPAWETIDAKELDIDYHLRHSALPAPGGERELGVLISRLHSVPLDMSRPLWECHLIEGLEDRRFALYMKAHHSLLDGMAAVRIAQSTLSENPDARSMPPPWAREVAPKKAHTERVAANPLNLLFEQLTAQFKTMPGVYKSLSQLALAALKTGDTALVAPYTAPASILNAPIGGARRLATQSYAFARIRALCDSAGGTVNDIVLAICAGGLRRYLAEINELPDKPLIANLPVSVRPKDDEGTGNAISSMLVSLATDLEDPKERLAAIRASAQHGKEHLQSMSRAAINNYTMLVMSPFMLGQVTGIGADSERPMFNVVISNVPGPKKKLYLNGAEMEALYPVSLIFNGQALNITVFTYTDVLNFSYTADRAALPHVQRLSVYCGEALDELETAYGLKKKKRASRKAG
jgi:diacylglycerol O-acyltransferase